MKRRPQTDRAQRRYRTIDPDLAREVELRLDALRRTRTMHPELDQVEPDHHHRPEGRRGS